MRARSHLSRQAFTILEMMIAIAIFSLIIAAIYASWTAILRASKAGKEVSATVQRSRMVLRVLEDSLTSAQLFTANQRYYGFIAENGSDPMLSFVARLSKSFPRSGKFGDMDVRRVTFTVEDDQLVLRQVPVGMEPDEDEVHLPIVLAKHVRDFELQFWDSRKNNWTDEWKTTNQLPRLVMFTLRMADSERSGAATEEINRVVSIPSIAVHPIWHSARAPANAPPGMPLQPLPGQGPNPGVLSPQPNPGSPR